jgi:Bacterial regulatory proteins, tetR family
MTRQVRSEATRRKILDAAIDVFGEVGYAAAAWGTIIERTVMTKGALYHHFDSKDRWRPPSSGKVRTRSSSPTVMCVGRLRRRSKNDPWHVHGRECDQVGQSGPRG